MVACKAKGRQPTAQPQHQYLHCNPSLQSGSLYLALLFAIAILAVGLSAAQVALKVQQRQQHQAQITFAGQQIVTAIGRYHAASPGLVKQYPANLQDLLEDRRFLYTLRHLRQIPIHPITHKREWQVVMAPTGGIMGIEEKLPWAGGLKVLRHVFTPQTTRL